jgi:VWFA-related protein
MNIPALLCLSLAVLLPGAATAQKPAGGAPATPPAAASTPPAPEMLLPVAVVDKHGALVTNLTAGDFTLTEDGRPQKVTSLTTTSPLPYWLGMVVDTGRQMSAALENERKAAGKFADLVLGDDKAAPQGNQVFLIHFDRQVELMTDDFTGSAANLHREIEALSVSSRGRDNQGPENGNGDDQRGGPGGGQQRGSRDGSTSQLYDAIWLSAGEMKLAKNLRRALIVFSDGVDHGSKETLNDAIDEAERNGVQVFTIYLKGEEERAQSGFPGGNGRQGGMGGGWPGSGGGGYPGGGNGGGGRGGSKGAQVDGKGILQKIAQRTGGQFFEAKKKDNLEEIYGLIVNALRQQYLLTYTPDQADPNGEYHKIVLKANKPDLTVITREGYYAKSKD